MSSHGMLLLISFGFFISLFVAILVASFSSLQAAIDTFCSRMMVVGAIVVFFAITGCSTDHEVHGDSYVHVVVGVDVTPCYALPEEKVVECIETMVELAEALSEKGVE